MRALMWFRSDLRIDDNRALRAACSAARGGVIGVFHLCPRQWKAHDWGDNKTAFVLANLAALQRRLEQLRIPLLLVASADFRDAPRLLLDLARRRECEAMFFNCEYEVNELARDAAVAAAFASAGLCAHSFHDQTVLPPAEVRTREGGFYSVFTPYLRAWTARARASDIAPQAAPRAQPDLGVPSDVIPTRLDEYSLSAPAAARWPAGEDEARKRLAGFLKQPLSDYRRARDFPALEATSALSPYLAIGAISPRRCIAAALDRNGGEFEQGDPGAVCWITELVWREFYRHVLVGFPRVCRNRAYRPATERIAWRHAPRELQAWKMGRTGVPIVDAGMRQLLEAGWMHNRLRMITAMFLSKNLLIDWRMGEQHFMNHLVDADLASNNGGWQWSASTGTDAAPYFRIFNPYTQGARFDAQGEFTRRFVPELANLDGATIHAEGGLPPLLATQIGYPTPIVEHRAARARALAAFKGGGE